LVKNKSDRLKELIIDVKEALVTMGGMVKITFTAVGFTITFVASLVT